MFFDRKIALKNPVTIDVNGLEFRGSAVAVDLIYLYPGNITVQVNPGNVFLNKKNIMPNMPAMPTMNQTTFDTKMFSDDEKAIIESAVDIIKNKISQIIDDQAEENVSEEE